MNLRTHIYTHITEKICYYTEKIAWDVLLYPEQLVAALVPAKKALTFDISPLSTS
jgi:hypothetical protein